jgi:hypothetical protein
MWSVLAAVGTGVAAFAVETCIARVVFSATRGPAVVARVGPAALGVALRASLAGGLLVAVACAVATLLSADGVSAAVILLVGVGVSRGGGSLAALL